MANPVVTVGDRVTAGMGLGAGGEGFGGCATAKGAVGSLVL